MNEAVENRPSLNRRSFPATGTVLASTPVLKTSDDPHIIKATIEVVALPATDRRILLL